MKGTRFRAILRESLSRLNREFRIAFTRVPEDRTWVFLVGCYNSGTTLLAELLGTHPDISALPTEGLFITDQFVKDFQLGVPRMWVDREDLFRLTENDAGPDPVRLKKEWGMRLDLSKPIFLEKSPPNAAKTRWLQANFANAKFIAIVRNGYAVAEGISRKAVPSHRITSWPIEKSAYQWVRSNEILLEDAEHLREITWVKYEDLAADTLRTLNEITQFLGIRPFADFESGKTWKIHERAEMIRNMNEESFDRLNALEKKAINEIAGAMLEKFSYNRQT